MRTAPMAEDVAFSMIREGCMLEDLDMPIRMRHLLINAPRALVVEPRGKETP